MTHQEIIDTYGELSEKMALRYRVRDTLILAVVAQESSGNPNAISKCGAVGLMQLMIPALTDFNRRFRKGYAFSEMTIPEYNIDTGSGYLSMLIQQLGDEVMGIRAYNQGAGRVKRDPDAGKWYSDGVATHEAAIIALKK